MSKDQWLEEFEAVRESANETHKLIQVRLGRFGKDTALCTHLCILQQDFNSFSGELCRRETRNMEAKVPRLRGLLLLRVASWEHWALFWTA